MDRLDSDTLKRREVLSKLMHLPPELLAAFSSAVRGPSIKGDVEHDPGDEDGER